jgi:hypothetical protein
MSDVIGAALKTDVSRGRAKAGPKATVAVKAVAAKEVDRRTRPSEASRGSFRQERTRFLSGEAAPIATRRHFVVTVQLCNKELDPEAAGYTREATLVVIGGFAAGAIQAKHDTWMAAWRWLTNCLQDSLPKLPPLSIFTDPEERLDELLQRCSMSWEMTRLRNSGTSGNRVHVLVIRTFLPEQWHEQNFATLRSYCLADNEATRIPLNHFSVFVVPSLSQSSILLEKELPARLADQPRLEQYARIVINGTPLFSLQLLYSALMTACPSATVMGTGYLQDDDSDMGVILLL